MAKLSYSAVLVCTLALVQISLGCPSSFPLYAPPIPITDEPTAPSPLPTDPSTGTLSPVTDPSTSDPSTEETYLSTDQTTRDMDDTTTTNATATPQPHCCDGKNGRTTAPLQWPATQSPAGGPAANPQAAVCIFYRGTNCLVCRKGSMTSKCCTAIPSEKNDTKQGGPTPYNEYLIGQRRNHPTHNIDWYNLYPRKEAPLNGYYGYNQPTATGRRNMGLHPGTITLGCVTVKGDCWAETKKVLESGNMVYNGSGYSGFLYVIPE